MDISALKNPYYGNDIGFGAAPTLDTCTWITIFNFTMSPNISKKHILLFSNDNLLILSS